MRACSEVKGSWSCAFALQGRAVLDAFLPSLCTCICWLLLSVSSVSSSSSLYRPTRPTSGSLPSSLTPFRQLQCPLETWPQYLITHLLDFYPAVFVLPPMLLLTCDRNSTQTSSVLQKPWESSWNPPSLKSFPWHLWNNLTAVTNQQRAITAVFTGSASSRSRCSPLTIASCWPQCKAFPSFILLLCFVPHLAQLGRRLTDLDHANN